MNPLDTQGAGEDAGLHMLMQQLEDIRQGVRDLKAGVGSQGAAYSLHDLTFLDGGNLSGYGEGDIEWSGSAHFSGETTIDGNLNLAQGIIGPDALASLFSAEGVATSSGTRPTSTTAWTTLATANLQVPAWATKAHVLMDGDVGYGVTPGGSQGPVGIDFQVGIGGQWAPVQRAHNTTGYVLRGGAPLLRSYDSPPEVITLALRARYNTPLDPRPTDRTTINGYAFFLR